MKKNVRQTTSDGDLPKIQQQNSSNNNNSVNQLDGFSLQSLRETFDSYGVRITNAGSFWILLDEVRGACYKDLLRLFLDKADTPETLVEMLKTQTTPNKDFSINHSTLAPFISKEQLDSYLIKDGVSASEFDSTVDEVKFLLSLYYAKGIDDFKMMLGSYLSDILSAHESGFDITELYENIMKIIKSRYEYLS